MNETVKALFRVINCIRNFEYHDAIMILVGLIEVELKINGPAQDNATYIKECWAECISRPMSKILWIKLYRAVTGDCLKDSKHAIDPMFVYLNAEIEKRGSEAVKKTTEWHDCYYEELGKSDAQREKIKALEHRVAYLEDTEEKNMRDLRILLAEANETHDTLMDKLIRYRDWAQTAMSYNEKLAEPDFDSIDGVVLPVCGIENVKNVWHCSVCIKDTCTVCDNRTD